MKKSLVLSIIILLLLTITDLSAQKLVIARCIPEVNIELNNGKAVVKSIYFDNGSFSYSEDAKRFTFSDIRPDLNPLFNESENSSVLTFFPNPGQIDTVDIYVWDVDNNVDHCSGIIHYVNPGKNGLLYGNIDKKEITTLRLSTIAQEPFEEWNSLSDTDGAYSFSNLKSGTYELYPYKDETFLDGITTLDIVLIQKHLLQLKRFDELREYYCADVSDDRKVDVFDLLQLRRLILGITTRFSNNSYRYMNNSVSNGSIQEAFDKGINTYILVDGDSTKVDLTKIKIGDINESSFNMGRDEETIKEMGITQEELVLDRKQSGELEGFSAFRDPDSKIEIHTPTMNVSPGEEVCIPVIFKNKSDIHALQFAMKWDTTVLKYKKNINFLKSTGFSTVSNKKSNEFFLLSDNAYLGMQDTVAIELCFEVVGNKGDITKIKMESNYGFENAFYSNTRPLLYSYEAGNIIIGSGCIDKKDVELNSSTGLVTVFSDDLFLGAQNGDLLNINGQDSISFGCDDEGINNVSVHYEGASDTIDCQVEVNVINDIKPIVICNNTLDVTLDSDFSYKLLPSELDAGSYDICGDTLKYSLSIDGFYHDSPIITFDCAFDTLNVVKLNVTNTRGKSDYCTVLVKVHYPDPVANLIIVKDSVEFVILPGYGVNVTADMLLIGQSTCSNNYDVRIFDKMPAAPFNSPGNVTNPIQNPGSYIAGVFDSQGNNAWSHIRVILPNENTVGFLLPGKSVSSGKEACLDLKVENFNDMDSFSLPISWNKDILNFKSIDFTGENLIGTINYELSPSKKEMNINWKDKSGFGKSLADNTPILNICFDAIANNGSESDINFSSPTAFTTPVAFNTSDLISSYWQNGSVKIEDIDYCSYKVVSLGVEFTEIKASDFNTSIDNTTVTLVNGESSIFFDCSDIGENIVELTVRHYDGATEKCRASVTVRDIIPPYVEIDTDTLYVKENGAINNSWFDIYDNCTYNYKITPKLDCNTLSPVDVTIEAIDIAGNTTVETKRMEIICTSNCAITKQVSLDASGDAIVYANSFKPIGDLSPVVLVNGLETIHLSCDDIGEKVVKLTKEDADGNKVECYSVIIVEDKVPPIAICHKNLEVRLNKDLVYELNPKTLDNGSFDGCDTDLTYSANIQGSTESVVIFDCQSDTIEMVILTVMDDSGNTYECTTRVQVKPYQESLSCSSQLQIKLLSNSRAEITPADILEGDYCYNNIHIELYDDIDLQVLRDDVFVDASDDGKTVYAKAIDSRTNSICITKIDIFNFYEDVVFKLPEIISEKNKLICADLRVENFKNVTSFIFPIRWDNDIVKFKGINQSFTPLLQDIEYFYEADSSEVIALWHTENESGKTLLDSAVLFNLCFETIGSYDSYSDLKFESKSGLVIPKAEVYNETANPDFIDGKISIQLNAVDCIIDTFDFILPQNECYKTIAGDTLPNIAQDGDTVLINGKREVTLPEGNHKVSITVLHQGGGISRCKTVFNIIDTVPPTVYLNYTPTVHLGDDLQAVLTLADFDDTSFDNCGSLDVDISPKVLDCNSPNPAEVAITFKDKSGNTSTAHAIVTIVYPDAPKSMVCADKVTISVYGDDEVKVTADMVLVGKYSCPSLYTLNLYDDIDTTNPQDDNVIDTSDIGNVYVCKVTHPDGGNSCWSEIIVEKEKTIISCVITPKGTPVNNVNMAIGKYTDDSGCVDLGYLSTGTIIKPSKNTEDYSGLDLLDVVMIRKLILGKITNFTPYQRIAADYNNNGKITTLDMVLLQKFLLGLNESKPWYFVDKSYSFSSGNIYDYPQSIKYTTEDAKYDFIGIKRGDVNFDYGIPTVHPKFDIHITDEILYQNEITNIVVKNTDAISKFEALQYTIYYNPDSIEVLSVKSNEASIGNAFVINSGNGVIKIVAMSSEYNDIAKDSELFTLKIVSKVNFVLHEALSFKQEENFLAYDSHTPLFELYTSWKDLISVNSKDIVQNSSIQLYPQPANDFVYIKFENDSNKNLKFKVTNLVGQQMMSQKLENNRIGVSHLQTGLYLVHFYDESGLISVKKLIIGR